MVLIITPLYLSTKYFPSFPIYGILNQIMTHGLLYHWVLDSCWDSNTLHQEIWNILWKSVDNKLIWETCFWNIFSNVVCYIFNKEGASLWISQKSPRQNFAEEKPLVHGSSSAKICSGIPILPRQREKGFNWRKAPIKFTKIHKNTQVQLICMNNWIYQQENNHYCTVNLLYHSHPTIHRVILLCLCPLLVWGYHSFQTKKAH